MIAQLSGLLGKGDINKERVIIRIMEDTDTDYLLMVRSRKSKTKDDTILGGNISEAYWFPPKEVKKGDLVILYTKNGDRSEKKSESGQMSYFFYWGRTSPLWDDSNHIPTLIDIECWTSTFKPATDSLSKTG